MVVTLIPRDKLGEQYDSGLYKDWEFARQTGTPYAMRRKLLDSPLGAPCTAPPWGKLVAVDLAHGKIAWDKAARHVARQARRGRSGRSKARRTWADR